MVSHFSKISDGVFEGRATDKMGFSVSDKMGILFLLSLLIWIGVVGWCDGAGLASSAGASYLFGVE